MRSLSRIMAAERHHRRELTRRQYERAYPIEIMMENAAREVEEMSTVLLAHRKGDDEFYGRRGK